MRPYQIKYFKQGEQSVLADLQKSIPIKSDALIELLNDVLRARGEMTEQTVHRNTDFEIEGTTTEKFSTSDALAHDLADRIHALAVFTNAALAKGVGIKLG
jgi:hypothetical protein